MVNAYCIVMKSDKIKAIIILERPQFGILSILCVLSGIFLANRGEIVAIDYLMALKLSLLFWFGMCAAHPINDYFDKETDKSLRQDAPLAAGSLSPNEVKYVAIIHYAIMIILIAVIPPNWAVRVFAILGLIVTYTYSAPPFRMVGRSILSPLTIAAGLIFSLAGGWASVREFEYDPALGILSLMIIFASVIAKNIADIADVEDDIHSERLTLPMQIGVDRTFNLSVLLVPFEFIMISTLYFIGDLNIFYLIIVSIAVIITIFAMISFGRDFSEGRKYSYMLLLPVIIFLISTVVGSI